MTLRINHNTSAINSHRNLQMNDASLSKSLEKLSSGIKINRAADGPAALVISEQMRAQIAGLDQAIQNSETAVSMVQTAEGALDEVNGLLISMRQLSLHAANEGVNDRVALEADHQEIANSLETIDRISKDTQFGTRKLLDGSNGANGAVTGKGVEFVAATIATQASSDEGYEIIVTQNASKTQIQGTEELTEELVKGGESFTITEGGKTATYVSTDLDTIQTAAKNLSNAVERAGLDVKVELDEGNRLRVEHNEFGSGTSFQVSSTTGGVLSQEGGAIEGAKTGNDVQGLIGGELAVGSGQILGGVRGAGTEGLSVRISEEQGDEGDIPEEGVLAGRVNVSQNSLVFQVGANREQTVGISLLNSSSDTLSKGLRNDSSFENLSQIDVRSAQGAQDAIMLIDSAINEVSSARAELGAFQKNTLESNISNLRIANENLVASESTIRDVDMAGEMANFTRNQIMTQSSTAMLAQANQVPGNVLQLLG